MGDKTTIFTIVAKNYLPQARVLMRSVAEDIIPVGGGVILVDQVDGYFDSQAEDFEIVLSRNSNSPIAMVSFQVHAAGAQYGGEALCLRVSV